MLDAREPGLQECSLTVRIAVRSKRMDDRRARGLCQRLEHSAAARRDGQCQPAEERFRARGVAASARYLILAFPVYLSFEK
jgi:hypothetical protein